MENLSGGGDVNKAQSLHLRKIKRRKKRTHGRDTMHDLPPFLITEKGKEELIRLGMREEDFHAANQ